MGCSCTSCSHPLTARAVVAADAVAADADAADADVADADAGPAVPIPTYEQQNLSRSEFHKMAKVPTGATTTIHL